MESTTVDRLWVASLALVGIGVILLLVPSQRLSQRPEQTDSVVVNLPACEDAQDPNQSCLRYADLGDGPQTYLLRNQNVIYPRPLDIRDLPEDVRVQLAE